MKFSLVLALFLGTSSAIKLGNKLTHGGPNIVQYIEVKTSPEEEGVVLAMLPKDNIYAQNKDDDKTVNPAAENDKKPKDDDEPPKEEKKEEAPKDLKSGPPPKKEKEPEPEPEKKERKVPEGGLLPHFINPDDHEPNMNRTEKPDTFAHQYIRSPAEKSRRINEDIKDLQHCPYFSEESDKLVDGRTVAIPYPKPHYNCKEYDRALMQVGEAPVKEHPPKSFKTVLKDGDEKEANSDASVTKPTFNESRDEENNEPAPNKTAQAKESVGDKMTKHEYINIQNKREKRALWSKEQGEKINAELAPLEKCPDFDERFTLVDGRTRAIPYPQPHYNCNKNYSFVQRK